MSHSPSTAIGPKRLDGSVSALVQAAHADPNPVDGHDIVERARCDRAAPMQDHHAVTDSLDLGQEVGVEDHRGSAIPGGPHDRPDVGATDRVERRGRLVEQDQLGFSEERDAQAKALLHALGEAADRVAGALREPDPVERLVDGGGVSADRHVREPGMQREDLPGSQPGLVPEELGQVADPRADGSVPEGCSKHAPRTSGGSGQAQQQLDRRGLARTVRPEETDELAAPDGQAEPVECGRPAKGLDDPVELDRGRRRTIRRGHRLLHTSGVGGDEGTRTPDPRDANAVLFQLSYIPTGDGL